MGDGRKDIGLSTSTAVEDVAEYGAVAATSQQDVADFEFSFDFSSSVCLQEMQMSSGRHGQPQKMLSAEELFFKGTFRTPLTADAVAATAAVETQKFQGDSTSLATTWSSSTESLASAMAVGDGKALKSLGLAVGLRLQQNEMGMASTAATATRRQQGRSLDDSSAMHMMSDKVEQNFTRLMTDNPRCISMSSSSSSSLTDFGDSNYSPRPTHRSCVSLSSSRCSSPSRSMGGATTSSSTVTCSAPSPKSLTFSQPLTCTSTAAPIVDIDTVKSAASYPATSNTGTSFAAHAARSSSKLLHFFRLGRHHHKEFVNSSHHHHLSRSFFWPFSRSNSAGLPAYSDSPHSLIPPDTAHLPRRSNSTGESKTTSSSLLPNHVRRNVGAAAVAGEYAKTHVRLQGYRASVSNDVVDPTAGARARSSVNSRHHIPRAAGDTALSNPPSVIGNDRQQPICMARPVVSGDTNAMGHAKYVCISRGGGVGGGERHPHGHGVDESSSQGMNSNSSRGSIMGGSGSSPGRQSQTTSAAAAAAGRLSPVRAGVNRSAGRTSSTTSYSHRDVRSSSASATGGHPKSHHMHIRPQDMLNSCSRDPASTIRVTPVLNVPACITPSSKSRIFVNIGSLFSKRDKGGGIRGYTILQQQQQDRGPAPHHSYSYYCGPVRS